MIDLFHRSSTIGACSDNGVDAGVEGYCPLVTWSSNMFAMVSHTYTFIIFTQFHKCSFPRIQWSHTQSFVRLCVLLGQEGWFGWFDLVGCLAACSLGYGCWSLMESIKSAQQINTDHGDNEGIKEILPSWRSPSTTKVCGFGVHSTPIIIIWSPPYDIVRPHPQPAHCAAAVTGTCMCCMWHGLNKRLKKGSTQGWETPYLVVHDLWWIHSQTPCL